MSTWRDNLLPGSWRGVPFHTESADAELGRRVALHEYPLRDKPFAEDLGRKARSFTLEVYLLGPGYMAERDTLIAAIELAGPGELIHPYLGALRCTLTEARGPRESTREGGMARFSLTFVEAGEAIFPKASRDSAAEVDTAADAAWVALNAEFVAAFGVVARPSYIADAAKTLVGELAATLSELRGAIPGLPAQAVQFAADLLALAVGTEALVRAPQDLASAVIGLVQGVRLLPDRPLRALAAYRTLWSIWDGAAPVPRTTPNRIRQADNQAALAALVQRGALIEAVRTSARIDFSDSSAALAVRDELSERLETVMDAASDDIYNSLLVLRTAMVRDIAARAVKLPRLVSVTPAATLPALLLAYRVYGDARRDGEIIERNRVRRPGFVPGGTPLEVLVDA